MTVTNQCEREDMFVWVRLQWRTGIKKPLHCEVKKLKDKSKVRNSPCASQRVSQLCSVSSCDSFLKSQPLGIGQFCIDLNFL